MTKIKINSRVRVRAHHRKDISVDAKVLSTYDSKGFQYVKVETLPRFDGDYPKTYWAPVGWIG